MSWKSMSRFIDALFGVCVLPCDGPTPADDAERYPFLLEVTFTANEMAGVGNWFFLARNSLLVGGRSARALKFFVWRKLLPFDRMVSDIAYADTRVRPANWVSIR